MYQTLIFYHSLVRWLVLISLCISIYKAFRGYYKRLSFTKTDNAIRHWTATIAHIQLVLGILLYTQSPPIRYFWRNFDVAIHEPDAAFFGLVHGVLMLSAIIVITIGSSLAKRRTTDPDKFRTMLVYFTTALIIIFIAIPWPFSPFVHRPYLR